MGGDADLHSGGSASTMITADRKCCTVCGQWKPITEFNFAIKAKGYRQPLCKICQREQNRQWRQKNHRKKRVYLCREYGLTIERYENLVAAQGGRCAICGAVTPGGGRHYLAIDHDHTSGKVRGLLCNNCNVGLGCFRDNPKVLRRAASYITNVV